MLHKKKMVPRKDSRK